MLHNYLIALISTYLLSLSQSQRDCPGGFYRINSTFEGCVPCPPGRYSSASHATDSEQCFNVCPPGYYCPAGSVEPTPCPGGRYSDAYGLSSEECSGSCMAGYFCPRGSTRATQYVCGNASYFCPEGSSGRLLANIGFYTGPLTTSSATRYEQLPCPPGSFCSLGVLASCPPGTFGNDSALFAPNCTGPCPLGAYCPAGTASPLLCPAGVYGGSLGLTDAQCSGPCAAGFWCPEGSISAKERPCPGGRYGPIQGLGSYDCSSVCEVVSDPNTQTFCVPNYCAAGYYCPPGSNKATEISCGGPGYYCPTGVAMPIPVDPGYYTVGPFSVSSYLQSPDDATTRTGQQLCEPGYYCVDGVKYPCPGGFYGDNFGLTSPSCSNICSPGYFCPSASTSSTQFLCGDPAFYCPDGSSFPLPVPSGYYSYNSDGSPLTRVSISVCPPGHYCLDGVKRPCPDGFFSRNGSTSPFCDGPCSLTEYCPSGTSDPLPVTPT